MEGNQKLMASFLKMHRYYELKTLKLLLREIRKITKNLPYERLTKDNAQAILSISINPESIKELMFKIHFNIGKEYGNRLYEKITKGKKASYPMFSEAFRQYLLNYYLREGGELIKLFSGTFTQTIVNEVIKATELNLTTEQTADLLKETINRPDFYKWQAMRIARTETSFAMNAGQYVAVDTTGVNASKVWITKQDGRERPSHKYLNGTSVPMEDFFQVGNSRMLHPSDKINGSAEECINCRCTYSYKLNR